MGYYTSYDGKINIKSQVCKTYIKEFLLNGGNLYYRSLFESKLDFDIGELQINEDRRNYNEEMEDIFTIIAQLDKEATGEIIAEGEDGENKKRFTIKDGKVIQEKGYVDYREPQILTKTPKDEIKEILEDIKKIQKDYVCGICSSQIDIKKFDFTKRGYYEEAKELTKKEWLCESCYRKVKKPLAEKRKLLEELKQKEKEINRINKKSI